MDLIKYKQIKNGALPKFLLGKLGSFIQPQNILPTSSELDNLDLKLYKNGLKNLFGHISPNAQNTTTITKPNAFTTENIVNAGADALGLISQNIAAARPAATTEDLVNNANKVTNSIDGFSFTTYGDGGEGKALSDTSSNATANTINSTISGAVTGSKFGWLGAAAGGAIGFFGGLFSGKSAKEKQMEAIRRALKINANKSESAFDNAYTLALQKKQAEEYGNVEGQQLFQAAYGKRPVWSPNGLVGKKATARVSNGEIIGSLEDGIVTRVPGEKNNKDTKLAALSDGDFVLSNKYGISDYAAATGDYLGALNLQEMLLGKMRNIHGYKNGKLPGFNIEAILPSLFNAGVGLDLIVRSKNLLSSPSSYVAPLTNLQDLHEISMSMLPIYANNRNIEARTRNAIVRSGGLGAGQIASALAANTLNTQLANSQALQQGLMQNNQYKANAITANYQADAQEAARKTAAGQWDYDKYALAHNAAEQQRQMGLYNIANAWREGYKNLWDREQFEKTYGLYFQDMKNKEMYYRFLRNGGMDSAHSASTFAPTLRQLYSTILNPYGMVSPLQVTSVLPTIEEINSLRYTPKTDILYTNTKLATKPKPTVIKQKNTTVRPKRAVVTEAPMKKIDLTRPVDKEYKFLTAKQIIEDNRNAVLGNLSNVDAKKVKPRKDATTNAGALKNMIEYLILGQKEYNKRYK